MCIYSMLEFSAATYCRNKQMHVHVVYPTQFDILTSRATSKVEIPSVNFVMRSLRHFSKIKCNEFMLSFELLRTIQDVSQGIMSSITSGYCYFIFCMYICDYKSVQ